MAKARMLHKKISVSLQANKLSLPARLLFTWMISHADDEGRLKGNPEYIKAMVVPMTRWSFKLIQKYIEEIKQQGLIYYWQDDNEHYIEFVKWKEYQTIRKDRFIDSNLPSFKGRKDNQNETITQPNDNQITAQSNEIEDKEIQFNKSEVNEKAIADIKSFKKFYDNRS